ncbi:uncharacterized protein [Eurosta solidaginis]|uniref:uncharacterized protein n=1 Tax=Eurosta solidaginis TaxID=178769 RepID=UPI0035309F29
MYHRPKILLLYLFVLQIQQFNTFPTIEQTFPDSRNYLRQNEKHPKFTPPELEETIEEVQRILARDSSLPRLTRGEIEELYEKVTREEYQKSIAAGDIGRADSMRALMLVLPYNTDNNTEENMQELYTRPPVTKVIDAYTSHQPIKFLTHDPNAPLKTETAPIGNFEATTYKPVFSRKTQQNFAPNPTTYHPRPPADVMYKMTAPVRNGATDFQPVTNSINDAEYDVNVERNPTPKPVHRYSSHYSAKNAEFLKLRKRKPETSTVRPVADILESLGIVGQAQTRHRLTIDDYYGAESAPQPVISTYVPQTVGLSELKELHGYSLSPKIKPDAYASFKPLNIGEEIRVKPEVEGYLTRFGIVGGRKRKDLKKGNNVKGLVTELTVGESEISATKLPRRGIPANSSSSASSQLQKLLQNLQELERLNVNPKALGTTTTIRPTTSSTTTTTTTTTRAPITPSLITNGAPLLIEAKKPRRRIDPNLDINFGNTGNHQTEGSTTDQLSKLLENLQELEKLRINPDNVLKTIAPTANAAIAARAGSLQYSTPTQRTAGLLNRFNEVASQTTQATRSTTLTDAAQLQQVLRQLQTLEQANARTTKKPTTQPVKAGGGLLGGLSGLGGFGGLGGGLGGNDVLNLQKLLTDDRELERLYEQARSKQAGKSVVSTTLKPPSTTTPTTQRALPFGGLTDDDLQRLFDQARTTVVPTTSTTSTTTPRTPAPSYRDFEQLQKYFAELERMRSSTTTTTITTTTPPPTTTTTTTTTPKPTTTTTSTTTTTTPPSTPVISSAYITQRITGSLGSQKPKKTEVDNNQLQELINRVQQLERMNAAKIANSVRATTTDTPIPFVGFTTRKVNSPQTKSQDYHHSSSNDFAHLQELYQQVASPEQGSFGRIEISTPATASKPSAKRTQNFAQKIIDITNDTGTGSSLQEVDPSDFVQLQKLLSKVQELERVKIHGVHGVLQPATPTPTVGSYTRDLASLTNLVTSASVQMHAVQNANGAQIVYAQKAHDYKPFEDILKPEYQQSTDANFNPSKSHVSKKAEAGALAEPTSSEELRELAMAAPANPKGSTYDKDFEGYQQFFAKLEDEERASYKNMKPPVIYKTVTKEPPRFIETQKANEVYKQNNGGGQQNGDLEELQKLLNNAQQLEKLGVTLPTELSQQIETKLTKHAHNERAEIQLETSTARPVHIVTAERAKPEDFLNSFPSADHKVSGTILPATEEQTTSASKAEGTSKKEAFFSLTTPKSLTPKEPKTTTSSALDLPVFSATKIIEAAIRRAANKIGVSTEQSSLSFQRRTDTDVYADMDPSSMDDLMGEFSEMNYQLAAPEVNASVQHTDATVTKRNVDTHEQVTEAAAAPADIGQDLRDLQRLISNLQELQRLNLTVSSNLLRQADAKYLETLRKQQTLADDRSQNRRQSDTPVIVTAISAANEVTTEGTDTNLEEATVSSDSATEDSTESSSNSATTTSTEESRNGSLADLEDSFGGTDTNKEEPKPPKRKNGFYFLADWNSFLEVGDGDDQVIVRLSPKIGDPRLFIPVKIP